MAQEEKELLLKDLCARVPYGVIINKKVSHSHQIEELNDIGYGQRSDEVYINGYPLKNSKPYLRPMSSMTEEEWLKLKEWISIASDTKGKVYFDGFRDISAEDTIKAIDYLLSHHFDFHNLIEKGLALEAPDGMYNKEESEEGSEVPVPKTVDEAVKTLAKILSKEDRDYLLENGAISMHHSLGRWIRNEWGLWTGSELKNELMNMNKGLNHPDDMSNYIIEEFIKYWNNKI